MEDDLERCLNGSNWSTPKFKGSNLCFLSNDKTSFEIPLEKVSICNKAKNEVSLEFHQVN